MSAVAEVVEIEGKRVKGRIEDGQEKVVTLDPLRERIEELVSLLEEAKSARAGYNDAVKATAEASGLQSSVVSKFVRARANIERFNSRKRDANQLSLCFEAIGLVSS